MHVLFQVPLAKEAGLCYTSVALVTDYDCWRDVDDAEHVSFLFCLPCIIIVQVDTILVAKM